MVPRLSCRALEVAAWERTEMNHRLKSRIARMERTHAAESPRRLHGQEPAETLIVLHGGLFIRRLPKLKLPGSLMAGCLPYVLAVDLLGACLVTSREERIDLRPPVRRVLAKTAGFYSCLPFP